VPTSHSRTLLSFDPLTSCPASVGLNWRQETPSLPFSHMSVLLVTALRLSPAERGKGVVKTVTLMVDRAKLATFRKMWSPVALELLELLARAHIPQPNAVVPRPSDELSRIRRVELDAGDTIAAIFSNVSFTGNCSTPLPR
jgi:hypothetical protein